MKKNKNKKRNAFQKVFDLRYFFYDFVKFTGALSALIILRVRRYYKTGKKPKGLYKGNYVIISNHPTFLDPLILLVAFWKRRVSFLATTNLFDNKVKSFFFRSVRMIPVEKENVKMETIKMAKDVIDSGHLLLVFPEGHVNPLDEIAEYKSGAVMIAMITKSPILPVYIKKREKWWQAQKVMIGEKINIEDFVKSKIPTMEDIIEVTRVLKQEEELLAKLIEKGDKQC